MPNDSSRNSRWIFDDPQTIREFLARIENANTRHRSADEDSHAQLTQNPISLHNDSTVWKADIDSPISQDDTNIARAQSALASNAPEQTLKASPNQMKSESNLEEREQTQQVLSSGGFGATIENVRQTPQSLPVVNKAKDSEEPRRESKIQHHQLSPDAKAFIPDKVTLKENASFNQQRMFSNSALQKSRIQGVSSIHHTQTTPEAYQNARNKQGGGKGLNPSIPVALEARPGWNSKVPLGGLGDSKWATAAGKGESRKEYRRKKLDMINEKIAYMENLNRNDHSNVGASKHSLPGNSMPHQIDEGAAVSVQLGSLAEDSFEGRFEHKEHIASDANKAISAVPTERLAAMHISRPVRSKNGPSVENTKQNSSSYLPTTYPRTDTSKVEVAKALISSVPASANDEHSSGEAGKRRPAVRLMTSDKPSLDTFGPAANSPAGLNSRGAILTNIPPETTMRQVMSVVFGGLVQKISYIQGSSSATVLFVHHEGCQAFFLNSRNGVEMPSVKGFIITVAMTDHTDPIEPALKAAVSMGCTRCIKVSGIDENWTDRGLWTTAESLGDSKKRAIEFLATYVLQLKGEQIRFLEIRFSDIYEAISFKSQITKSTEWNGTTAVYIPDPCNVPKLAMKPVASMSISTSA